MKGETMKIVKIINVVVSFDFSNNNNFNFDNFLKKLQERKIIFDVKQLNKVLVASFRYKNCLIRVFPTGNIILLISKPLNFDEVKKLTQEVELYLNDLIHG